jgi:hypothetical protein
LCEKFSEERMTFGTFLNTKLFSRGLSVLEFCQLAEISRAACHFYLMDQRCPQPEALIKMGKALDLDPLYMARFVSPKPEGRMRSQRNKIGPKIVIANNQILHKKLKINLKKRYMKKLNKLLEQEKNLKKDANSTS